LQTAAPVAVTQAFIGFKMACAGSVFCIEKYPSLQAGLRGLGHD